MSFTCPVCWRTSYSDEDERWGYCGNCHDFTGGYGYGDQRHSSSSTPAGKEREMRMPTNDEDGKAKPEMLEVQGEGNCDSLRELRRERMERKDEPLMRPLQRDGIPTAPIPPREPITVDGYPSKYRFYIGALGLGFALGTTITQFLFGPLVARHIPKSYAITTLYICVAIAFAAQTRLLYRWNKALAKHRTELARYWDENFGSETNPWRKRGESTKERYGLTDEE